MSYEEMVAAAAAAGAPASHDYSKMYAGNASSLNKPTSLPASSSGAIDTSALPGPGSSSFKHLESGKSFNYSVPAGVGGSQAGYYMQVRRSGIPLPEKKITVGCQSISMYSSRMTNHKCT